MENVISNELMQEIINNLILLIDDLDIEKTKLLINMTCKEILIKTNRINFPTDLKYLVIDLVKDAHSAIKIETTAQPVQSMSEDGRSVNFGIPSGLILKYQLYLQNKLETQKTLINRYRLLYKAGGSNKQS